jgi:hypothetical protein
MLQSNFLLPIELYEDMEIFLARLSSVRHRRAPYIHDNSYSYNLRTNVEEYHLLNDYLKKLQIKSVA